MQYRVGKEQDPVVPAAEFAALHLFRRNEPVLQPTVLDYANDISRRRSDCVILALGLRVSVAPILSRFSPVEQPLHPPSGR
jgi:hypothetical protein